MALLQMVLEDSRSSIIRGVVNMSNWEGCSDTRKDAIDKMKASTEADDKNP